jgi:hypothetical protein
MTDVGPETETLAFRDDDLAAPKPDDPRPRCRLILLSDHLLRIT